MDPDEFRRQVLARLEQLGWRQAELARRLNVDQDRLSKWLSGSVKVPYQNVSDLCRKLGLGRQQQVELFAAAGFELPKWVEQCVNLDTTSRKESQSPDNVLLLDFNEEQLFRYVKTRILEARKTVCDLTWGVDVPIYSEAEAEAYDDYVAAIPQVCARNVVYKEIMTFHEDPVHFIGRAERMLECNLIGYNLRYYDVKLREIPSLLSFALVDDVEVILFGFYRWPYLPVGEETKFSTTNPILVRMFKDYFDAIWHGAKLIKDGDKLFTETFNKIKQDHLHRSDS